MRKYLVVLFLISANVLLAQPGDPGGGGNPTNPVPISGIELLIGVGAAYGITRKWLRKEQPKD